MAQWNPVKHVVIPMLFTASVTVGTNSIQNCLTRWPNLEKKTDTEFSHIRGYLTVTSSLTNLKPCEGLEQLILSRETHEIRTEPSKHVIVIQFKPVSVSLSLFYKDLRSMSLRKSLWAAGLSSNAQISLAANESASFANLPPKLVYLETKGA